MKKQLALALALMVAPCAALAADKPSYSYIEASWARLSVDAGGTVHPEPGVTATMADPELDGYAIRGSVELGEAFYLFGGYQTGTDDTHVRYTVNTVGGVFTGSGTAEIDSAQSMFGVGYRHGLSDRSDMLVELAYVGTQIDVDNMKLADGSDVRVGVGLRGKMSDRFEGLLKANYTDGDVYEGEFSATVGGEFKFSQTWGLTGEAEIGNDFRQYMVGIRASF